MIILDLRNKYCLDENRTNVTSYNIEYKGQLQSLF